MPKGRSKQERCLQNDQIETLENNIKKIKSEKSGLHIGMLDMNKCENGFVLIESHGDFISQGFKKDKKAGNILEDNITDLWIKSGKFNPASHLTHYINH